METALTWLVWVLVLWMLVNLAGRAQAVLEGWQRFYRDWLRLREAERRMGLRK